MESASSWGKESAISDGKRSWRQIDLAAHAELVRRRVVTWRQENEKLDSEALKRIAEALDKTLSDLLDGI